MIYMAEIHENKVVQIIVFEKLYENEASFIQYCETNFGGNWVQTWQESTEKPYPRGQYAGQGMTYDPVADEFVSPVVEP